MEGTNQRAALWHKAALWTRKRIPRGNGGTIARAGAGTVSAFLLPAMLPLFVFWIYPIFRSIWISLTDWDYMSPSYHFVGLRNYIQLFRDPRLYEALWNTAVFCVGTLVPTLVFGLLFAVLLRDVAKGRAWIRWVLFSPWITPTVAISIVWSWMFQSDGGLLNQALGLLHLPPLQWIRSSDTAMLSVILVTVWKSVGYAMIFYATALERVPRSLYEAATIDGASAVRRFWDVTLPAISPTTFFLSLMTMVSGLQAYDQIQILTQGGPAGSTRTLLYMYYQLGFEEFQVGTATAVATVLLILTAALSAAQFSVSKKWVHYE